MINRLEKYDLNCSVFNSYDFDDCLDLNSLLCRFFTKINECIQVSNEALTLMEWLRKVGLKEEVNILLNQWKNDGTLSEILNEELLNEINNKVIKNTNDITKLTNEVETNKDLIDGAINDLEQHGKNIKDLQNNDIEINNNLRDIENKIETNKNVIINKMFEIAYIVSGDRVGSVVNNAINLGYQSIKIPKGNYTLDESIIIRSNVELFGDKGTIITTYKDIPIITTSKTPNDFVDTCFIHDLHLIKHSPGTSWHLDLCNVNLSKVKRIRCEMGDVYDSTTNGGLIVWSNSDYVGEGGAYSLSMEDLDFRSCSLKINITDCYLTNSNIWGKNRKYCLWIASSSQQILNNQFVGSSWGGGIYIKNEKGYDVELLKINNNFFDGSYDNIDSGDGIYGENLRSSTITGNTFWRQSNTGITLINPKANTITGNIFEDNGKKNINGVNDKIYDIKIAGTMYSNVISNNTFACYEAHKVKNGVMDISAVSQWDSNSITSNLVYGTNNYYDLDGLFNGFSSGLTNQYIQGNGCMGHWLQNNIPN